VQRGSKCRADPLDRTEALLGLWLSLGQMERFRKCWKQNENDRRTSTRDVVGTAGK